MIDLEAAIEAIETEVRRLRREGLDSIVLQPGRLDPFHPSPSTSPETAPSISTTPSTPPAPDSKPKPAAKSRPSDPPPAKLPGTPADFEIPADLPRPARLEWLRQRVVDCPVCNQNLNPTGKVVFGIGPIDADIFFCGEAPGAEEEKAGEPFVGPAGDLLNRMIGAMGLTRDTVYISNILNWRPQTGRTVGNRPPTPEEMAFCMPYLRAQIEIVRPRVIVALGATAATALLGRDEKVKIGSLRGTWNAFGDTPLIFTYHPSFILHNGTLQRKREIWEDLLAVMQKLEMPISAKQQGYFLKA